MSFRSILSRTIGTIRPANSPSLAKLQEHVRTVSLAGETLDKLLQATQISEQNSLNSRIVSLEKNADMLEKEGADLIHRAIILPFDRSMLLQAFEMSDNVIDNIRKAAFEIVSHGLKATPYAKQSAEAIQIATRNMIDLPDLLRSPEKNQDKIWSIIQAIHEQEKHADNAYRSTIENIRDLAGPDPIEATLILRIADRLEAIADNCEDFALQCGRILSDNS